MVDFTEYGQVGMTNDVSADFLGTLFSDKAKPIGSMVLLYMVTWIPSIYPQC